MKVKKLSRKGQAITFPNAPSMVMLFVVIVLILGAGATAIESFRNSGNTGITSFSDSNSITSSNTTATFFGDFDSWNNAPVSCTSGAFYNGTEARDITSMFTISTSACTALLTNGSFNAETIEVNYTLTITTYDHAYNISQDGLAGANNLSLQLPTVGTMLGVGLMLIVIIGIFAAFSRKE